MTERRKAATDAVLKAARAALLAGGPMPPLATQAEQYAAIALAAADAVERSDLATAVALAANGIATMRHSMKHSHCSVCAWVEQARQFLDRIGDET